MYRMAKLPIDLYFSYFSKKDKQISIIDTQLKEIISINEPQYYNQTMGTHAHSNNLMQMWM